MRVKNVDHLENKAEQDSGEISQVAVMQHRVIPHAPRGTITYDIGECLILAFKTLQLTTSTTDTQQLPD